MDKGGLSISNRRVALSRLTQRVEWIYQTWPVKTVGTLGLEYPGSRGCNVVCLRNADSVFFHPRETQGILRQYDCILETGKRGGVVLHRLQMAI